MNGDLNSDVCVIFSVSLDVCITGCVYHWVCVSLDVCITGCVYHWVCVSLDVCITGCVYHWMCVSLDSGVSRILFRGGFKIFLEKWGYLMHGAKRHAARGEATRLLGGFGGMLPRENF